jgi:hypothetical protein
LSADFERRSLADQIIDQLLAEDPTRYEIYEELRGAEAGEPRSLGTQSQHHLEQTRQAIGRFLSLWIDFERFVRSLVDPQQRPKPWLVPTTKLIEQLGVLDTRSLAEIARIRRFRNNLVHGVEVPSTTDIEAASNVLETILTDLKGRTNGPSQQN